ncbi:MAG: hypothetical protein JWN84_4115 [Nocardioides sp.]|jgi:hypothetical protein|nr:hypothetical protein [Nocardioides sp.]
MVRRMRCLHDGGVTILCVLVAVASWVLLPLPLAVAVGRSFARGAEPDAVDVLAEASTRAWVEAELMRELLAELEVVSDPDPEHAVG